MQGILSAITPGVFDGLILALDKYGTKSFAEVAAPAIEYAEHGFPMRQSTARAIEGQAKLFERFPGNKAYWYKADGTQFKPGETIKLPATARTLHRMV